MLTIRIVKAKPWPRTFVGDKWGDWDLSLRFPVRIHFRLSHWSVHMIWNGIQFADGVSIPGIVSFQDEEPWLRRIVPDVVPAPDVIHAVPTLPAGKAAIHEETASGLKIRCDKQGGILEIVDPRMFRPGSETFCRGLSATAISLGGASGVDLDLPARSCRFHFEPDRFDEAELARRVSLAIEAATMAAQLEASGFVGWADHERFTGACDHQRGTGRAAGHDRLGSLPPHGSGWWLADGRHCGTGPAGHPRGAFPPVLGPLFHAILDHVPSLARWYAQAQ